MTTPVSAVGVGSGKGVGKTDIAARGLPKGLTEGFAGVKVLWQAVRLNKTINNKKLLFLSVTTILLSFSTKI